MYVIIDVKHAAKVANKSILSDLCNSIDIEKSKQNLCITDRIAHKVLINLAVGQECMPAD